MDTPGKLQLVPILMFIVQEIQTILFPRFGIFDIALNCRDRYIRVKRLRVAMITQARNANRTLKIYNQTGTAGNT
jgi:hypothetical protein